MWPPRHRSKIESEAYGWLDLDQKTRQLGEQRVREKYGNAYGAFAGQEAINKPTIDWQEQIHRDILRGLRNISETP